jgi:hypothetical protein
VIHHPLADRRFQFASARWTDDLSCGDGRLAAALRRPAPHVPVIEAYALSQVATGVDHPEFDGRGPPVETGAVDAPLLIDVLHHGTEPQVVFAKAARVAGRYVIVKYHLREGLLAAPTLRVMDWVGNARFGVSLPFNYLDSQHWARCIANSGLAATSWDPSLGLYPPPLSALFERRLHFLARLEPPA